MKKYLIALVIICFLLVGFLLIKPAYFGIGTSRTIFVSDSDLSPVNNSREALSLKEKEVILTFDDGPKAGSTDRILDILKAENIKSTFFLVGKNIQKNPGLLNRIVQEGHVIGSHSWSHKRYTDIDVAEIESETSKGLLAIEENIVDQQRITNFFRYPYLSRDKKTDFIVQSHDLNIISGDFMAQDWKDIPPQQLHDDLMRKIKNNGNKGIVIMHDVHDRTVEYLKLVLKTFKKEDYKIVHLAYKSE